jgi:hypothetical protein
MKMDILSYASRDGPHLSTTEIPAVYKSNMVAFHIFEVGAVCMQ